MNPQKYPQFHFTPPPPQIFIISENPINIEIQNFDPPPPPPKKKKKKVRGSEPTYI